MVVSILLALSMALSSATPRVVNLQEYNSLTQQVGNDTLYIANFWATWCKPCVAEMPYFVQSAGRFRNQKVRVIFVSLNSVKELETVAVFLQNKKVSEEVCLLHAGNPNDWIDKIDSTWSGAIPATAMYRNAEKVLFYEGEFTQHLLDSVIQTKIR